MFRIGYGNDIHRLVAGRPLMLGGVAIESDLGAEGHARRLRDRPGRLRAGWRLRSGGLIRRRLRARRGRNRSHGPRRRLGARRRRERSDGKEGQRESSSHGACDVHVRYGRGRWRALTQNLWIICPLPLSLRLRDESRDEGRCYTGGLCR